MKMSAEYTCVKYFLYILCLLFVLGCRLRKSDLIYNKNSHTIQDLSGKKFKNVRLIKKNLMGSTSCTIYYYEKLTSNGQSIMNLEFPDTIYFRVDNSLNCELTTGIQYTVIANFIGQNDTIEIVW